MKRYFNYKIYENIKNSYLGNNFTFVKSWFSSPLDSKIYVILAEICLILLLYSIWEIKPVIVDIKDFLGLTSHLTAVYWIGYVLVLLFSIRLYLDKQIKKNIVYIIYLVVIGLFLFGVPVFAEENARFPWSYYPAGEVKTVLETKYIDTASKHPLISYRSWPATHLISASILYITSIKIESLLKYMPLFWLFTFILITFSIGKRIGLLPNQSFIASFLILSSFWNPHYYYGPPSFAYLLYLMLFMSIVTFGKISKIRDTILIPLIYTATVITHILTNIAIISSFIFSSLFITSIYKKRIKYIVFFLIIPVIWYTFFAPVMFEAGFNEFIKQITELDFLGFLKTEKYSAGALLTRWITHYSRLFYLGIYAITMTIASIFYLTGRFNKENKELIKICLFWFIGILMLLAFGYGRAEIDDRVYLYSLIPMAYIITLIFNRKILVLLTILLIIPHIPAHYGTESFDLVRTTELNGAEFFAFKTVYPDNETYFSMWDTFVTYYDPEKITLYGKSFSVVDKPDISKLDTSDYIITSIGSHDFLLYSYGFDPLKEWIDSYQDRISLFYDNGYYQIYKNNKVNII